VNAMMMLAVLFVPVLRDLFKLVSMDSSHWMVVLALIFIPIPVVELMKVLKLNGNRA